MFYSHTFLARKGPLGTVWCAAHLQHKLKKAHYISTDVGKTVKLIMYPEVPIALRMSGHLLLGVVRIYSKQVDYLYEDCNETRLTINRVFTAVSVNLPNDATHAPVHSITLPEKFNLDAIELDDLDWGEDSHLKNKDEITLTEQIPTGRDQFIAFSFDELHNDLRASQIVEEDSGTGATPMEIDDHPNVSDTPGYVNYPSPSGKKGPGEKDVGNSSPQINPSAEIQRDGRHGFDFLPEYVPPDPTVVEQIDKDNEKGAPPEFPDEHHFSPGNHEERRYSPGNHSPGNHEERHPSGHIDSPVPPSGNRSFPPAVDQSVELEIQPSPLVEQPRPRRNRKRKLFDDPVVLTNGFMRDALNNTTNIRRARRNCPLTSLAIQKQNNRARLRKEGLFIEPFITGVSTDLQGIYREDSVKHHLVPTTEAPHQETNVVQSPLSKHGGDSEVEIRRDNECASPVRFIPGPSTYVPSPSGGSCFTPGNSNVHFQSGTENDISPTVDRASTVPDSVIRTPNAIYEKNTEAEIGAFSDIPEMVASPGELGFLEQDDNSPARSQGTPATGDFSKNNRTMQMSSRTRAVAQYLERQSVTPIPGNSDEPPEDISLNKILQGQTRKVCARMFYETLVLKSHGLVDAKQEHPYGDITLKVTPKLSKGKFPA